MSVRSEYSDDWEAEMSRPLQQAGQGGDDLGHGDRHHCRQWRHQLPLAETDSAQPWHGLLADGLGQHGDRQVHGGHMVGEARKQREMTPGGLSASLPSRLTESTVRSEDRSWLGLDS